MVDGPSCRYPDQEEGETPMWWDLLVKAALDKLKEQAKPLVDVLVAKAVEYVLKHLSTRTGVMPVLDEESLAQLQKDVVEDMMNS